jgi:hypothetical protein
MRLLINHLGNVEAERFIALMNREPFDYTQWQQDMFTGMSVKELSKAAMQEYSPVEEERDLPLRIKG